ncbi:hypothetical protein [Chlamydia avium]|uniref:Uncharacterized protein n=1 Tax=Chlamydia avium TaxID=1457141 RepID=A0ABP2X986_9CHLA|nr:hypothetical protein [Chlamydia avium]EPP36240.1 hypothetical protein CP10743SC13_0151 [Chlamydia psittaci 10_743_SC13]EPP38552.1 hypothetical protein CP10881SC42_0238 [Chlamydia avium]
MVNPIGPIDESTNVAPADLSTLGMQASAANRSAEAQKIAGVDGSEKNQSSVSAVGTWSLLSSAKSSLTSLFEKISNFFSGSTSTSTSTITSFEEAQTQANSALTALQNATSYADFKAAVASLQEAVDYMNANATDEQKQVAAEWQTKLNDQQDYISQVTTIGNLLESNQTLLEAIKTSSSLDQIIGAAGLAEENQNTATELIEKLKESYPDSTLASNLQNEIDTVTTSVVDLSTLIQEVYDAGQGSAAAVEQAQANNSQGNIDACKQIIDDAGTLISTALTQAPNSPIVQEASKLQQAAAAAIEEITPSGGGDVGLGGPGGPASVGTSQNKGGTIADARVSMLLAEADNETASTLIQGFRRMIELFHSENPDISSTVSKLAEEVKSQLQPPTEQSQAIEQALQGEGMDFSEVLGAIAEAASLAVGSSTDVASMSGSVVSDISQVVYSKGSSSVSSFVKGYSAYRALSNLYAESSAANREILDNTTLSTLQSRPSRSTTEVERNDDSNSRDPASSVARMIVDSSSTLGDVYSAVSALEDKLTAMTGGTSTSADSTTTRSTLTSGVTEAPKSGYPYVQLSSDSTKKFIEKLEAEFAEGSKRVAELQEAVFEKQSQFIQQVLVNIASLFSGYLQ